MEGLLLRLIFRDELNVCLLERSIGQRVLITAVPLCVARFLPIALTHIIDSIIILSDKAMFSLKKLASSLSENICMLFTPYVFNQLGFILKKPTLIVNIMIG